MRGPDSTRLLPKGRLEAFSDGVFAIVITLLVLELKVPEDGANLWHELSREWPAYLGYFISFAFICGSWIVHSNMTRVIKSADAVLMRLNLLLLLAVSFLPFTTSLIATPERPRRPPGRRNCSGSISPWPPSWSTSCSRTRPGLPSWPRTM